MSLEEAFFKKYEIEPKHIDSCKIADEYWNNEDYEFWKYIKGYEGIYQVSNYGRIKSFHKNKTTILKPRKDGHGYYFVTLCKNNTQKNISIHRAVALEFIPNYENKPQINHKDGNPTNNKVSNLEWCTPKENMRHKINVLKYRHSEETKLKMSKKAKGRKIHENTTKAKFKKVRCIETEIIYNSQIEAEQQTGVPHKLISACCTGKNKTAYKYHWEFVK